MDEKLFLNESNVSVSNVRFIAQGQTYAMSGVTAVKTFRKDPPRKLLIGLGVLGAMGLMAGNITLGLATIAMVTAIWFFRKAEFSVMLSSASGENKALTSNDGAFIARVVGALNDAIVHRG